MPKNKKRKNISNLQALEGFNLTGVEQDESTSLEACMHEFGGNQTTATVDEEVHDSSAEIKKTSKDSEKAGMWNHSLKSWIKSDNYPPGLLPSIDEELARHFHAQDISKYLLDQGRGNDLRMPTFERWLIDSKLEEKSRDPVFPTLTKYRSSPACNRLLQELVHSGLEEAEAEQVVAELCRKVNTACQDLASKACTYERTSPLKKGDRMVLQDKGSTTVTLLYSRKKWTKPFHFTLNKIHYKKLKDRFFEVHDDLDSSSVKILRAFHLIVVALMLRYSSMSGGQLLRDLRGGGMQGAIHEKVFDTLQGTWKGPWTECFASPFNVYLPTFGSAFPDLDWHFGSIGNFFEIDMTQKQSSYCEANPPFSPGIMSKMVDRIVMQLAKADRLSSSLTFVVIVPTAGAGKDGVVQKAAAESFNRMLNSVYCRLHMTLSARDHGYIEGAQHLRTTRYKQSSYDTSVIVLQSSLARRKDANLDTVSIKNQIKMSFASQHEVELKKRKAASLS